MLCRKPLLFGRLLPGRHLLDKRFCCYSRVKSVLSETFSNQLSFLGYNLMNIVVKHFTLQLFLTFILRNSKKESRPDVLFPISATATLETFQAHRLEHKAAQPVRPHPRFPGRGARLLRELYLNLRLQYSC